MDCLRCTNWTAMSSMFDNSRKAGDEVHFCLVADACQICVFILTFIASCCLIFLVRRCVEAVAVVVMPAGSTRWRIWHWYEYLINMHFINVWQLNNQNSSWSAVQRYSLMFLPYSCLSQTFLLNNKLMTFYNIMYKRYLESHIEKQQMSFYCETL